MPKEKDYIAKLWLLICQENDARAYETLFLELYQKLVSFCITYVEQKVVAEEIVADVFVKCWMNRASLAHINNIKVYLYVSVKNRALNHIRNMSALRQIDIASLGEEEMINAFYQESNLEKKEIFLALNAAIEMLPPQSRIVFRMIKEDGFKYKEVAEILDISPRTVQTQLFRAIARLRKTLQPYLLQDAHPLSAACASHVVSFFILSLSFFYCL